MASWNLSPQYKKNAVERQYWYKDGKCIVAEEGFRWANFTVESDERPLTDEELKNEDGYELGSIENDESWELQDMTDGCWRDTEAGKNCTEEDLEEFDEAWEENSYEGVEALGWSNDDTEYWYYGPLELTNEDTGEVFKGEPDDDMPVAPAMTTEEKVQLVEELEAEVREEQAQGAKWPFSPPSEEVEPTEPELTDWFHSDHYYPTRKGTYQVTSYDSPNWPFPTYAEWNGKKWSERIISWRGLVNDPGAK